MPPAVTLKLDGQLVVTQVTSSTGVLELTFGATSVKSVRLELVQANSNWWSIDELEATCLE